MVRQTHRIGESPNPILKPDEKSSGKPNLFLSLGNNTMKEEQLVLEHQVAKDEYNVMAWIFYLDELKTRDYPWMSRCRVYERALRRLPGSYKLWYKYLQERKKRARGRRPEHPRYEKANKCFERALVYLHKMPVIWEEYCEFLLSQNLVIRTRRALDSALKSLPVTQHERVWRIYLKFIRISDNAELELGSDVFERYLKYDPSRREEYVEYLLDMRMFGKAAEQLALILQDDKFTSREGKTKHQLWMELCDMLSKYAEEVSASELNVEAILRTGLKRFTDETAKLWCCMADYYIRVGNFEQARNTYEESIMTVMTVRDFSTVFDAYSQFQEALLTAKIEMHGDGEDIDKEEKTKAEDESYYNVWIDDDDTVKEVNDVDLLLGRLEHLLDRRPLLLNSVMLRQNPNNIEEWHKRAKLYQEREDISKVVQTYSEAIKTVDVSKVSRGKPETLWIALADVYEKYNSSDDNAGIENACQVYENAIKVPFKQVDQLAGVWCAYAELLLRVGRNDAALVLMQKGVLKQSKRKRVEKLNMQRQLLVQGREAESKEYFEDMNTPAVFNNLHKSTELWMLYIDLEESFGTIKTARAAYERMLSLKIATPATILNYAMMLEENKFFEDSFRAYEKGIALFPWPHVKEIWVHYLHKFVKRYKGDKLDRGRELFEEALREAPADMCKPLFLMYVDLEENYGLTKRAMSILDRMCNDVKEDERFDAYILYLMKVEKYYGVAKTREIYEKAIEKLDDNGAKAMCLLYSDMERNLGEIDRARAILRHGSQFADPRISIKFWKSWHEFEVTHGNEDTFREMLRIKRSVQNQFASESSQAAATSTFSFAKSAEEIRAERELEEDGMLEGDANGVSEARLRKMGMDEEDIAEGVTNADNGESKKRKAEVSVDYEAEAEKIKKKMNKDENMEIDLEEVSVPKSVFGDAIAKAEEEKRSGANKKWGK